MTPEEKIEALLFVAVASLDLPGNPPYAWPNKSFPGEDDAGNPLPKPGTYIEVRHLPNTTARLFAKGTDPHLRQGILQLTAVTPLKGGATSATRLAGVIAAQFPADRLLFDGGTRVRVQATPDVRAAEKTDVSWDAAVSIRYECFG